MTETISAAAATDSGFACLAIVSRFFGKPLDPSQLRHEFALPSGSADAATILRAAKRIGFKARSVHGDWRRLERSHPPAIAELSGGRFVVIARVAPDKVLIDDPAERGPRAMSRIEFEALWTGVLILIASRARLADAMRRFDFTWFIPAILRYRRMFADVLVASFFLQLFALVTPLFFQVVVDKVLVHRGLSTLDVLVFALVVVTVFEAALGGVRAYVFAHTTSRIDVELGARLFHHVLALPLAYFQARRVGDTVARVRELETIRNFLTGSAVTVAIDVGFTFVFLAVMYWYSPLLTWIVLATIPAYVALSLLVTPALRRRLDEKFNRGAENQAFLVEAVTGVETVKAMAVEPRLRQRWEEQLAGYVGSAFRAGNLAAWAGQSVGLVNKLAMAGILWLGARLVIDGDLTVGELVAFNMLAGRVGGPIMRLAQLWQDFQQVRIAVERLGDILNTPIEPAAGAGRGALPALAGRVTLEHVGFRYRPDASRVLDDISLDVPAGQLLGIVGPSGSGKSTLTKLIQRMYLPESGRVLVDGVDLALVDPAWLRRQIGVVLQENVLFNRSVRENIALADPGLLMERVIAAATLAGAHEFILQLPEGYDTLIGERGATLSGGQRQRIAIARALIVNPRILILDEATSALDYESERIVQDNMRAICRGRTVIVIAHRLAAVRNADRIVTVEAGRIVEDGTHDELVRRGGRYASLHRHQLGLAGGAT